MRFEENYKGEFCIIKHEMFYSFYFQIFVAIKLYLERSAVFKILENRSSSKSFRSIKLALFKMSRYKMLTVSINIFSFKGLYSTRNDPRPQMIPKLCPK